MSSEWPEVTLGQVATARNGAGVKQIYFAPSGVPLARVTNFTDTSIDLTGCVYVAAEHAEIWRNHRLQAGDVVVATVGSWPPNWASVVGKAVRVPTSAATALQNQNTCCVKAIDEISDQRFIYYRLKGEDFVNYAANSASGSANQARLTVAKLEGFRFRLPPLRDQIAIASALGALDDRIALLRDTNATLETIAQTLFKSWFVNFDPVHAKQEGREPEGMDDAMAALFPSEFEQSELGLVPKGWRDCKIADLMELAYGKALKSTNRIDGAVPVYGSGGITGRHNESLVDGPSIVIGRKGTVGTLYWEDRPFYPIDTVFYVKANKSLTYCFYLLQTLGLKDMNTDGAVPGLNRNNVYRLRATIPPDEILSAFDLVASTTRARISANRELVETLTVLRDTLLRRLISGQLRLPQVEQFVESRTGT